MDYETLTNAYQDSFEIVQGPVNIESGNVDFIPRRVSFSPQREGLSIDGKGLKRRDDNLFFQNYQKYRGKFFYPYSDDGILYYPYFFKNKLYYYPFSMTDLCFCEDDHLQYKVSSEFDVKGRCVPCYQCRKCSMDNYFMCQNIFPVSG